MHTHSDRRIKSCKTCQKAIRAIEEAGKELDRLGTWLPLPKKLKKGFEYKLWKMKLTEIISATFA